MSWVGVILLAALGALGWHLTRPHSKPETRPIASPSEDAREAELLRTTRERPKDPAAHQELGAYRVAHEQPFEGLWDLMAARELGLDDAALAIQIGSAIRAAGLPEAAIAHLDAARRLFPSDAGLDLALARAHLAAAQVDAALAVLQANSALARSPEGLSLLALARAAAGETTAARAALKQCRELAGKRADLRLATGWLAVAMGDTKQAREDLEVAAEGRPNDEEAQYYAGFAYAAGTTAPDQAKAVEYLQAAIRAAPRKARAGYTLGLLLYETQGRWEKALDIYRRAAKLDPNFVEAEEGLARVTAALKLPETLYHEARVREMTQQPDAAIRFYRRWGERQPERWDSVLRVAECWMDMQRNDQASREVQRGLRRFPDHSELYNSLTQICLLIGGRDDALRLCERWAPRDTTSGRPERIRGKVALESHDLEGAVRWLDAAIAKDPSVPAFHADLAAALVREPTPEHLTRARVALQRAIDLDPRTASYHQQLGSVLQQLGDPEGARLAFLRALSLGGDNVEPYPILVSVAQRDGRPATASLFAALERQVRDRQRAEMVRWDRLWRQPRSPEARYAIAQALCRRGALQQARDHLSVAVAQRPDWPAAQSALRRVRLLADVLQ